MNPLMLFIPAVVMLAPIAMLLLVLRHRADLTKARYQTLLQLAEKGVDLPHDLLAEPHAADGDRRRALVLVAGGLGLMAMFLALPFEFHSGQPLSGLWGLGLLPLFTGVGYGVHWCLAQRDAPHG